MNSSSAPSAIDDESSRRWVVLAAGTMLMMVFWVASSSFGVFIPFMVGEFGWPVGQVSAAYSLTLLVGGPLGVLAGWLADRHAPWKIMLVEVGLAAVGYVLLSGTQWIWQLYLFLGLMVGAGMSGAYVVPTTVVAKLFRKNRGLAMGITLSGQSLGPSIGPLLAATLIEGWGWRSAYVGLAVLILGFGGPFSMALGGGPRPARNVASSSATNRNGAEAPSERNSAAENSITLRAALRTKVFWFLSATWLAQAFAQMMFTVHFVPMEVNNGVPLTLAAGALGVYGVSGVAGRLVWGLLSDWVGIKLSFALSSAVSAVSVGAVLLGTNEFVLYVAAAVYGFSTFGADTVSIRALPDLVGTRSLGSIMSAISLNWRLGAAIGPLWAGLIYDATGYYSLPFQTAIAGILLSILLFAATPQPRRVTRTT